MSNWETEADPDPHLPPAKPLELYRPSNGSEGEIFEDEWCCRCTRDEKFRKAALIGDQDGEDGCPILGAALALPIDYEFYPKEWVYGLDGRPKCTAYEEIGNPPRAIRCDKTIDLFKDRP